MIVPAVSAKKELSADSGKNLNKGATTTDYIIAHAQGNSPSNNDNVIHLDTTYYITQRITKSFTVQAVSGKKYLEVDLNWNGNTKNSLALTIYTPSGSNLGTCYDISDGSVNGRTHINIYPKTGYVEKGVWSFNIYGKTVSGTQYYTFRAYAH